MFLDMPKPVNEGGQIEPTRIKFQVMDGSGDHYFNFIEGCPYKKFKWTEDDGYERVSALAYQEVNGGTWYSMSKNTEYILSDNASVLYFRMTKNTTSYAYVVIDFYN